MEGESDRQYADVFHLELGSRIAFFIEKYYSKNNVAVSLTDLANEAGISPRSGMMTQLLQGKTGIEFEKLEKIAKKLQCEVETLSYQGHIAETDLPYMDAFFRLWKKGGQDREAIKIIIDRFNSHP